MYEINYIYSRKPTKLIGPVKYNMIRNPAQVFGNVVFWTNKGRKPLRS